VRPAWIRRIAARTIAVSAYLITVPPEAMPADHPWDGPQRAAWIEDAARRVFVLEGSPDVAQLTETCVATCPQSAYMSVQPTDSEAEVHFVGVYEGPAERDSNRPPDTAREPAVDVRVRRTAKSIVLVLTSHEPVAWKIHVDDGANLRLIRWSGRGRIEAPQVPIEMDARLPGIYSLFGDDDGPEMPDPEKSIRALDRAAGRRVDTFQGSYKGGSFTVPFCHDVDLVREVIAAVRTAQDAKRATAPVTFDLVVGDSLVRFNDAGVAGACKKLVTFDKRDVLAAVFADVDGRYYAITQSELFAHDPATGATAILQPPPGYPEQSRLEEIAYDARAKRVTVRSDDSFWYTFEPATGEWRLFELDHKKRPQFTGITFDRDEGVYYALSLFWPPENHGGWSVVVLDALFHPQRAVRIVDPGAIPSGIQTQTEVAKAGESLVVCVRTVVFGIGPRKCRLVNLSTGEVRTLTLPAGSASR
jgi:hypothetical protein